MAALEVLSIDLGASNGRGILASFDGQTMKLQEVHRFVNEPVVIFSHLYWDTFHLYKEVLNCLRAASQTSSNLISLGIDGWSQDFGLLDKQGHLLGLPRHYRDPRTQHIPKQAFLKMPAEELFSVTGKVPSSVCTLFQLLAMKESEPAALENSSSLLFMPNLLGYYLTGEINCDVTLASASALYNAQERSWSDSILRTFGLPQLMPAISPPGHTIGCVREDVKQHAGISGSINLPLISVAQHDTISAILAVEAKNRPRVAYISCGTWSVVGITAALPILSDSAMKENFCSEAGYYEDTTFVVKYLTGLWILQECIREWSLSGKGFDYEQVQKAAETSGFRSHIDVQNDAFSSPGNMPGKIVDYCKLTGQRQPQNEIEIFMTIMKGLALQYAETVEELQALTGQRIQEIHMIGGGSRNAYLCKLTAQHSGTRVVAGPHEASAVGNALVQLIAHGEINGIREAAQVMQQSFQYKEYY
ncbi:rhamnulokinase [Paenibacillus eucommiae]|uniref:Sugar (Pentulose or hexulose) kinase n=1 Tax=Paenibacillus eucommiae TaxID=1355755 RepID=A0ABS4J1G5_9BACL|nr:rhamnulokinase family protein [Paenibacillus eucommiae]MBP1993683.1 sugar (pentulose or hexulose) kinase [Paenibacillus eucommiae]